MFYLGQMEEGLLVSRSQQLADCGSVLCNPAHTQQQNLVNTGDGYISATSKVRFSNSRQKFIRELSDYAESSFPII